MKKILLVITSFILCACQSATSVGEAAAVQPGGVGKVSTEYRVLLTGDSLMASMGPQLKRALAGYENLTLVPLGKGSTGLSRPDFYNWPKVLEHNLKLHRPHLVFMWIGTNDLQDIYGYSNLGEFCSKPWGRAYLKKIQEIIFLTHRYRARLVFIGPPCMRKEPFNTRLKYISQLYHNVCKFYKIDYINTRNILSDRHGNYQQYATINNERTAIRTSDHIHITSEGNKLVMKHVLRILNKRLPKVYTYPRNYRHSVY